MTLGSAAGSRAQGPLIGRESDLKEFRSALEEARAGHGRLFLLTGDAGIGKSRLLEAVAEAAEPDDVRVAWGRCWEGGGAAPFWPWAQVLRSELAVLSDRDLPERLGNRGRQLVRLVPELALRVSGLAPPPVTDLPGARYALFEAVSSYLCETAGPTGLVILLDDLHAADDASLQLLQHVVTHLSRAHLLVIGTYRDTEVRSSAPLHRQMSAINRLGRRLTLTSLDEPGVAAILGRMTGLAPAESLVRDVHRASDGNPFFVQSVARLLAAGGPGADSPLPSDVHALIRRRLEPLTSDVRDVLVRAAVLGPDLDLRVLRDLSGHSAEVLVELLATAASLDVVEEAAPGRWSFSHALLREVLRDDLRPSQRVALHRQAGEVVEAVGAGDPVWAAPQLAHHFFQSARGGDAAKAATYCAIAADQAMGVLAFEQAALLYGRALDVLALTPLVDERRRYDLLAALGTAKQRSGDLPHAQEAWRRAAKSARALGSGDLLAEAAIAHARMRESSADESGRSLLEEARAALPPDGSPLLARVLVELGLASLREPISGPHASTRNRQLSRELADEGLAVARRVGDTETLRSVLWGWHLATSAFPELLERRLQVAQEIFDLAVEAGDRERVVLARQLLAADLLAVGDIVGAAAQLEAGGREADDLRMPFLVWGITVARASLAQLRGQPDEAERLSRDALAIGERSGFADVEGWYREQRRARQMETGQFEELEAEARRSLTQQPMTGSKINCRRIDLALSAAQLGRPDEARSLLQDMASPEGFPPGELTGAPPCCPAALSEVCWLLENADPAPVLSNRLIGYAGRHVVFGVASSSLGPGDRYLGQLAALDGRFDDAEARFDAAADLCRQMGAPAWLARTEADHARMLLMRDGTGDRSRARQLADAASAGFAALGLAFFEKQVAALVAAPSAAVPAPPVIDHAALVQEGDYWAFAFGGEVARLRDSKGVRYLARLLRNPGRELHAVDLVAGAGEDGAGNAGPPDRESPRSGGSDTAPLLDARAKAAYRQRLTDLQEDLEEANSHHDPARAERAQEEIDSLVAELTAALGLGSGDHKGGAEGERARQSVTRAVKGTVQRLGEAHPDLGEHLRSTVRTGVYSSYVPDPRAPITWEG